MYPSSAWMAPKSKASAINVAASFANVPPEYRPLTVLPSGNVWSTSKLISWI